MNGRFVRLGEKRRETFRIYVDGMACEAANGDTLLVALLNVVPALRDSEFGDGRRAGFCLMGACQDCWVWCADGARVRACTTLATPGMCIVTKPGMAGGRIWPRA